MDEDVNNGNDPTWLYSYYVETGRLKEIRTINEYQMRNHYGGQSRLEEFLRLRCTRIEFLGIQFVRNESMTGGAILNEGPGAAELQSKSSLPYCPRSSSRPLL